MMIILHLLIIDLLGTYFCGAACADDMRQGVQRHPHYLLPGPSTTLPIIAPLQQMRAPRSPDRPVLPTDSDAACSGNATRSGSSGSSLFRPAWHHLVEALLATILAVSQCVLDWWLRLHPTFGCNPSFLHVLPARGGTKAKSV